MMRLDRLAALVATVSPDRTSTVADAAAARWGLPAGTVRYVRTSATCVFATGDGYLRLRPVQEHRVEDIRAVEAAAAALSRAGAPVVTPRASTSGRLSEVVPEILPLGGGRAPACTRPSSPPRPVGPRSSTSWTSATPSTGDTPSAGSTGSDAQFRVPAFPPGRTSSAGPWARTAIRAWPTPWKA